MLRGQHTMCHSERSEESAPPLSRSSLRLPLKVAAQIPRLTAPSGTSRAQLGRRRLGMKLSLVSILALVAGCARPTAPVKSFVEEPFPENLSDWRLFVRSGGTVRPNQGVLPYDLNTPLFSDYASKYRFVWMPPGTAAQFREDQVFDFPVGTILVKTFAFPAKRASDKNDKNKAQRIETRLLVHAKSGWVGLLYVWNQKQSEATLQLAADPVAISYSDASGKNHYFTYFLPNANESKQPHTTHPRLFPIGP